MRLGRKRWEREELLQRLAAIEARLEEDKDRLTSALQRAADATEAWRITSRELADLRLHGTSASVPIADAGTRGARPLGVVGPDALAAWVRWVVRVYDLAEYWPPCWQRHEGLVLQLVALRRWHVALSTDLAGDPTAGATWFDALYRLNDHLARPISQSCLATHRDSASLDGDEAILPPKGCENT